MPKEIDAASKYIMDVYPADWLVVAGLPRGKSIQSVDSDLSTVSRAADKLMLVKGRKPYIAHIEFQAQWDGELDERVLEYNVLARRHYQLPVLSTALLLRPEALPPAVVGRVWDRTGKDHELKFRYKLVPVWRLRVKSLLTGGLGTLPLAPISAVEKSDVAQVIDAMRMRLERDAPSKRASELWTATRILMGLRYSRPFVNQLLRGVKNMEESTTYQEIIEKGIEKGMEKGIEKGMEKGLQRGLQTGIERGIEKGRVTEARAMLLRLGTRKFGAPAPKVISHLNSLSDVTELESLGERVVDKSVKTWNQLLE